MEQTANDSELAVDRMLTGTSLPRLLYVGDAPVESSYHGSALLYRLLQDYPADRLRIVEAEPLRSLPARRLPGVEYDRLPMGATRWRHTRFARWVGSSLTIRVGPGAARLHTLLNGFDPEAVLTVAHGYSWLSAARFAEELKIPLHLIVHDDWPSITPGVTLLQSWQTRQFGKVYRQAASRLCVSPFMEHDYRLRFGVAGHVLYPSRAKDGPAFECAPAARHYGLGPLVGGYAGNIFGTGYARLIASLATSLERRGGRLLLFGPHSAERLRAWGLDQPSVVAQGLVDSPTLIRRLRDEVDFVFVPMTFEANGSERNMQLSFPSKLTDYTATGLPLLIWGPEYCSAVRWAQQYIPVAEVVTSESADALEGAVNRLQDVQHRALLGKAALEVGNQLFSHGGAVEIFFKALSHGLPEAKQACEAPGCHSA